MSKYIDAEKLLKDEIARCHCVPWVGGCDNDYKNLDEVLNDAPTADVVEVRHGEWKKSNPYNRFMNCSVCGFGQDHTAFKYCPNCGAKYHSESDTWDYYDKKYRKEVKGDLWNKMRL